MIAPAPELAKESTRLAALRAYEVLDTQAEAGFDRLVRVAATAFNAPISLLSLVDEHRQWFKARVGLDVSETPRAHSFCSRAIEQREPLVVTDASRDPGFRDLATVATEDGIRFYAGAPLVNAEGHALGALCVLDRRARETTAAERQFLTELAALAMEMLEQRRLLRIQRQAEVERVRLQRERDQSTAAAEASHRQLAASERLHRLMFESHPQPLWVYDSESLRFVTVNQAAVRTYGYSREEFLAKTIKDIRPEEDVPRLLAYIEGRSRDPDLRAEPNWRHRRKDGSLLLVEIASHPLDIDGRAAKLVMVTDVTEKRQLQEQFLRAQRMENLGLLAAGISHDLNNIFTPLMMVAPLLGSRLTGENDRRVLATIEQSVRRGAGLVKQILTFSRGSGSEFGAVQLKHVAREIAGIVTETFPRTISFQSDIPSDLWPVRGNPTQIHQVLLNLSVNARDAMPEGGRLRLGLANCEFNDAAAAALPGARAGRFVRLEVSDTGTGIPAEIAERIWEPFFTTKENGRGTGLGLSTVRGIVAAHQGFVALETEVGRGSTFRVYLPAEVELIAPSETTDTPHAIATGKGELILFVDDEPDIRSMAEAALLQHGYRVIGCPDGARALEAFRDHPEVRLVITDFHMPGMDGERLAKELHLRRPSLPIMICSGTSGRVWSSVPHEYTLLKPFSAVTLLQVVADILAAARKRP